MSADTQSRTPFAETRHHMATTAALVTLFWIGAASAVALAQKALQPFSPSAAAVVTIAAILLAAHSYTRFCARYAGISHALGVGIAWLALSLVTELVMAAGLGRDWNCVLGSPDHPLFRNVLFFVWIFAAALFARREDGTDTLRA